MPREKQGAWPLAASIGVLVAATAVIALEAELVAGALEVTAATLGLSNVFVGVVAPLLVIASWILGQPMTLVFGNPLDLFAIAGTAFIVNAIASDGEATWFEGVLLIGVYVLLGLAFFLVSARA